MRGRREGRDAATYGLPGLDSGKDDRVLGGREVTDVREPSVPFGSDLSSVEVVLWRKRVVS